jgi:uncharacterized membrane protein
MTDPLTRLRENAVGVLSTLVLGLGFVAMAANVEGFWLVWVLGFAVVVPIVSALTGEDEERERSRSRPRSRESAARERRSAGERDAVDDALATLRDRYARGELSDEAFERKLEALLETETPEAARDVVERRRERGATAEREG